MVVTTDRTVRPDHQAIKICLVGFVDIISNSHRGDHCPIINDETTTPAAPDKQMYGTNTWGVRSEGNLYNPTVKRNTTSTAVCNAVIEI